MSRRKGLASRACHRARNWLRYGQKEVVYPKHFFLQLAVCAVLFLVVCGMRSTESEPVQAALADLRAVATTEVDIGESIGKLEFVGNFVPESVMVFWNGAQEGLAEPFSEATPLLEDEGWTLFAGKGALLAGGEGEAAAVEEVEGGYRLTVEYDNGLTAVAEPLLGVRVAAGERVHEGQSLGEAQQVGDSSRVRLRVLRGEEVLSAPDYLR